MNVCVTCSNSKETGVVTKYEKTISKLIETINSLQATVDTMQKQLNDSQTNTQNSLMRSDIRDMDAVIQEMEERDRRSRNIIIYDIVEINNDDVNARINHDTDTITKLLKTIDPNAQNCNKVRRLGKKDNNDPKPRPILVTLDSKRAAVTILKSARMKKIKTIKNDLTPIQREKLKSLQDKLKMKHDKGETFWTIKYVKGSPQLWNTNNETDNPPKK
uniref:Uncharacterized protein n=1 Tax=Cacopsylla melanoneura TaxID=428564 RepID=A0A8D9AIC4_9HEMI